MFRNKLHIKLKKEIKIFYGYFSFLDLKKCTGLLFNTKLIYSLVFGGLYMDVYKNKNQKTVE